MNTLQKIEWFFRHRITYPVLSRVFRNKRTDDVVDLTRVRSILILRYDRFGDMVVTSPITRHIKALAPGATIGIAASAANAPLARRLPGVDKVHVVTGPAWKVMLSILKARFTGYDVVLNFIMNRTSTGGILANVIAPSAFKVGQGAEKYAFYFNRTLSLGKGRVHMVNLLDRYCAEIFGSGWGTPDLRYEIIPDPASEERVSAFLKEAGIRALNERVDMVVLNTSAGERRRDMSLDQIASVARYLSDRKGRAVVLVGSPDQAERLSSVRKALGIERVVQYPASGSAPFMDMVSLIRRSAVLVTPDTSLVHVAGATHTPVVSFYARLNDFAEWSPVGIPYEIARDADDAAVRNISVEEMISAVQRLDARRMTSNHAARPA